MDGKYQARTTDDPELTADVDELINAVIERRRQKRGSETIVVKQLMKRALDGPTEVPVEAIETRPDTSELTRRVADLAAEVADLRSQLQLLRGDFGHCTRSLLVSAGVSVEDADAWLRNYYDSGGLDSKV